MEFGEIINKLFINGKKRLDRTKELKRKAELQIKKNAATLIKPSVKHTSINLFS
jgi:hypothetical protein